MRKREKEREKERIGDEERERREREREERRGEVSKRTGRSLNTFASAIGSLQSGYAVLR